MSLKSLQRSHLLFKRQLPSSVADELEALLDLVAVACEEVPLLLGKYMTLSGQVVFDPPSTSDATKSPVCTDPFTLK